MIEAGEIPPTRTGRRRSTATRCDLPFPDDVVRPHHRVGGARAPLGRPSARSPSSCACCARAAGSRSRCRPSLPERVCWALDTATTTRPAGTCASTASASSRRSSSRPGLVAARLAPRARAALAVLVAPVRVRRRQHRRAGRCAGTTTSSCSRSTRQPAVGRRARPRAQPGARQEPRRLHAEGRLMSRRTCSPTVDGILTARELAETVDAIARDPARRRQHPVDAGRSHRPVEPGRGGDGARPRRPPRRGRARRTSGCAGMQRADGGVARLLPRQRRSRTRRSTPTSPATSRPACGTTTSSPATPRTCASSGRWSRRAIDFALDFQTRDRRDRVAGRRPRRRRAAHRVVEHPPQPAVRDRDRRAARPRAPRLGAVARRARHRHRAPSRRVPRQGPLGDGLVLPDPRRRAARLRRRDARVAARWATFVVEGRGVRCVSDRPWVTAAETCELVMALDAIGEPRARPPAVRAGCSSCAPTAAATGPAPTSTTRRFHLDGELYPVEQPTWNSAAVVLAANALAGDRARPPGCSAASASPRASTPTSCSPPASRSTRNAPASAPAELASSGAIRR